MYGPKNASASFSSNEPYPRHIPLHSHEAPSQMKSAMSPPASPTYSQCPPASQTKRLPCPVSG